MIDETAPVSVKDMEDGALLTFNSGNGQIVIKVPSYEVVPGGEEGASTIWRFDKPVRNAEHPTMKPIGLCARAIQNSSKRDEIILDPFCGSGSTIIAAEQLGRVCYAAEIDPKYCDVIVRRWQMFSNQNSHE